MRMVMTPTEILEGFLNSDGFDDLVAMRLKLSLEDSFDTLARLSSNKELTPYQWDDYVDTVKYGRALITVLEWFTVEDLYEETLQMNTYSMRLDEGF